MPETFNTPVPQEQTCPTYAYQASTVCVPITVTPFARTGDTVTKCCGASAQAGVPLIQWKDLPCDCT